MKNPLDSFDITELKATLEDMETLKAYIETLIEKKIAAETEMLGFMEAESGDESGDEFGDDEELYGDKHSIEG